MDVEGTVERTYRSPRRVLVRVFERSRNRWKAKVAGLRSKIKDFKVRVYDLEKSRAQWRELAEQRTAEIQALTDEVERLRNFSTLGSAAQKKNDLGGDTPPSVAALSTASTAAVEPVAQTEDALDDSLARQSYGLTEVSFACRLVLEAGVSLRSVPRVMTLVGEVFGLPLEAPHYTTPRNWLLRLGCYKLERPKEHSGDWVWIIDHVTQIGQQFAMIMVGVQLSALPAMGECLTLPDLEPLAIIPVTKSTGELVGQQLLETVAKTGKPVAIIGDGCNDLRDGVRRFCAVHPDTIDLIDIAHKAACLLQGRLERDPRWQEFCKQFGQSKQQTQQTELAFLVPPGHRNKARFMNLEAYLNWAVPTLAVVDDPPAEALKHCTPERLQTKLGWLKGFRAELELWSEYHALTQATIDLVRRQGYHVGTNRALTKVLRPLVRSPEGRVLRHDLQRFVWEQSRGIPAGRRIPASSEILESSFGRFKELEGNKAKGGLGHTILAYAALLGSLTTQQLKSAIEATPLKHVTRWCQKYLGQTLHSKRTCTYRAAKCRATKTG